MRDRGVCRTDERQRRRGASGRGWERMGLPVSSINCTTRHGMTPILADTRLVTFAATHQYRRHDAAEYRAPKKETRKLSRAGCVLNYSIFSMTTPEIIYFSCKPQPAFRIARFRIITGVMYCCSLHMYIPGTTRPAQGLTVLHVAMYMIQQGYLKYQDACGSKHQKHEKTKLRETTP